MKIKMYGSMKCGEDAFKVSSLNCSVEHGSCSKDILSSIVRSLH